MNIRYCLTFVYLGVPEPSFGVDKSLAATIAASTFCTVVCVRFRGRPIDRYSHPASYITLMQPRSKSFGCLKGLRKYRDDSFFL
ncbi:hypothetical protein TNCV_908471 [Trichonephila clavipes]|nr:hypothetical protein TNCV_908471 [Trichonephila clavipes]